jgi:uncharacterized membrane protein YgaE (UPF0421/DUF939 family)
MCTQPGPSRTPGARSTPRGTRTGGAIGPDFAAARYGARVARARWLHTAVGRLRDGWRPIVEATAAATVAWVIATQLVGHPRPFFAPAAALIVLGQARGQRVLRAVEVLLGVAGGVLVADVVAQAVGPHTTLTVSIVVALTVVIAVAVGASTLLVVQASVSALYVAVISPASDGIIPFRFVDALVGGGVALVVSRLARPGNPLLPLIADSRDLFAEVSSVLNETAEALVASDRDAAIAALERARGTDLKVHALRDAVSAVRESLVFDVRRRQRLPRVHSVESSISQVDYVVRTMRVLTRATVSVTRAGNPPPDLVASIRSLAAAVRAVEQALSAELAGDPDRVDALVEEAEHTALDAVRIGARLLPDAPALPVVVIVGQVRNAAIDLLRALGVDDVASITRVDEALGLPTL